MGLKDCLCPSRETGKTKSQDFMTAGGGSSRLYFSDIMVLILLFEGKGSAGGFSSKGGNSNKKAKLNAGLKICTKLHNQLSASIR